MNKTYTAKLKEIQPVWYVVDAADQVLGRLATAVATILCGKNKPTYTPHIDTGDFVVVINAGKVKVTGNKAEQMHYNSHSGFPGGFRRRSLQEVLDKHPHRVIEHAVKGMLPKTTLGRHMALKLKVYASSDHPHAAQKPIEFKP